MYPDPQLIRRVTVVMVSQIPHKLSKVNFGLVVLPPINAKLLNERNIANKFK